MTMGRRWATQRQKGGAAEPYDVRDPQGIDWAHADGNLWQRRHERRGLKQQSTHRTTSAKTLKMMTTYGGRQWTAGIRATTRTSCANRVTQQSNNGGLRWGGYLGDGEGGNRLGQGYGEVDLVLSDFCYLNNRLKSQPSAPTRANTTQDPFPQVVKDGGLWSPSWSAHRRGLIGGWE